MVEYGRVWQSMAEYGGVWWSMVEYGGYTNSAYLYFLLTFSAVGMEVGRRGMMGNRYWSG